MKKLGRDVRVSGMKKLGREVRVSGMKQQLARDDDDGGHSSPPVYTISKLVNVDILSRFSQEMTMMTTTTMKKKKKKKNKKCRGVLLVSAGNEYVQEGFVTWPRKKQRQLFSNTVVGLSSFVSDIRNAGSTTSVKEETVFSRAVTNLADAGLNQPQAKCSEEAAPGRPTVPENAKVGILGCVAGALTARGIRFLNTRLNLKSCRLATGKGIGDGGNGNGGGGGGGGGGGNGDGRFDGSSLKANSIFIDGEEDETLIPETSYKSRRNQMLASLSTAAGDVAADGDAPFRELRKGWMKRSGVGEELEHFAKHLKGPFSGVKAPSKASGDDSKAHPVVASSAGGISGDEKTEDCLNFLAPNETSNTDKTQSTFGLPKNTSVFSGKERDREAAAADAAALAVKLLGDKTGDEALAKSSETGALKRLQREAFADLLKVRERLDKLEHHTGLRRSKAASGEDSTGPAKTHLKGEVNAGTAFILMEDNSSRCSRAAIVQAGLHTGLDIRFTFETPFREKDLLLTQCTAGNSGSDRSILGGPISITKIIYSAHVTDDLTVMVAPLGAHGSDMTEIVNPLQGQALTEFARAGPALYNHCYGSALGATLKGNSSALSVSQYLSDWGSGSSLSPDSSSNGLLCLSTLAQILFQPWENSVFSLSAVNRFWPSPPLPSSSGLHWSEMGALVLAKSMRSRRTSTSSANLGSPRSLRNSLDNPLGLSANASWGTPFADADRGSLAFPENQGTAMQSVAIAGEIDVGANLSLGGWVQVERGDWLQEVDKKNKRWAVSLARSSGVDVDWGICCGSSKIDLLSVGRTEDNDFPGYSDGGDGIGEEWGSQLQIEAFMKLRCGHGFSLQPGLVYLLNKQSQTPAFMLRASWTL